MSRLNFIKEETIRGYPKLNSFMADFQLVEVKKGSAPNTIWYKSLKLPNMYMTVSKAPTEAKLKEIRSAEIAADNLAKQQKAIKHTPSYLLSSNYQKHINKARFEEQIGNKEEAKKHYALAEQEHKKFLQSRQIEEQILNNKRRYELAVQTLDRLKREIYTLTKFHVKFYIVGD